VASHRVDAERLESARQPPRSLYAAADRGGRRAATQVRDARPMPARASPGELV
jgi:hypothetical protein